MTYLFNGVSLKNGRHSNMDSLFLKSKSISGESALLAVVGDGVGSLADGAFASREAVRILSEWFEQVEDRDRIGLEMRDVILGINDYIISEAKRRNIETASTISVLLLIEDRYYTVHVGDSRIYSCENGVLTVITEDDISESGKLTACIGQARNIVLQYSEGTAVDKTFLICSDGLYNKMDKDLMIDKMIFKSKRALKESMEALTQYAIQCGERDNISLALVKLES